MMKVHLYRPGETMAMCGLVAWKNTSDPWLMSCKTCRRIYENDVEAFNTRFREVQDTK